MCVFLCVCVEWLLTCCLCCCCVILARWHFQRQSGAWPRVSAVLSCQWVCLCICECTSVCVCNQLSYLQIFGTNFKPFFNYAATAAAVVAAAVEQKFNCMPHRWVMCEAAATKSERGEWKARRITTRNREKLLTINYTWTEATKMHNKSCQKTRSSYFSR